MDIALRTYTVPDYTPDTESRSVSSNKIWTDKWPGLSCTFDCETSIDKEQKLKFGVFRVHFSPDNIHFRLIREAIFYDERNLTEDEINVLQEYCTNHNQGDIEDKPGEPLLLLTLGQFIRKGIREIYEKNGILVGFNLPFDISRIAAGYSVPGKGIFTDGFRFHFSEYTDKETGETKESMFFPRIGTKAIGQRMTQISFLKPLKWRKGKAKGYCLDLAQLVNVLSGKTHSLKSACQSYGVEHGKIDIEGHGIITPEYIDYCRRDVLATSELYIRLMEEYHHHPIPTTPNKIYSAASLGKGYLKAMNVKAPELKIDEGLSLNINQVYGILMSSLYAGRTECRIRKIEVPIVYADFKSMYSTVNILMKAWELQTAKSVSVTDDTDNLIRFIDNCIPEDLFKPETWVNFRAMVEIIPDGDFLPTRNAKDHRVVWGYVSGNDPLWYALPDALASKLITGKSPKVIRGIRFLPEGKQVMRPVMLAGKIPVNPFHEDFYRLLIEERERTKKRKDITTDERNRIDKSFKILASSTSYGITIEMNRKRENEDNRVNVYSDDGFQSLVNWYEEPGKFYFPVLGVMTTSAAHLMLTLAQYLVESRGGTYAMMDTDSIAIVADEKPGSINGKYKDKEFSIPVLSKKDVSEIIQKFNSLNPYAEDAVSGSILIVEKENYPPKPDDELFEINTITGEIRKHENNRITDKDILYGYFISSKRYALFNRLGDDIVLRKGSEIALGAYIPPEEKGDKWISRLWLRILAETNLDESNYAELPALRKFGIRTPTTMKAAESYNRDCDCKVKPYYDCIKPFGFMVSAQLTRSAKIAWTGKQVLDNALMIAPYTGVESALKTRFVNLHDPSYSGYISVNNAGIQLDVKSYLDVIRDFIRAPESKFIDVTGEHCTEETVSPLFPPQIWITGKTYIGKESGELEDDENFLLPKEARIQIYQKEDWEGFYLPWLKTLNSLDIAKNTGFTKRAINYIKSGRRYPKPETMKLLIAFMNDLGNQQMIQDAEKEQSKLKREYRISFSKCILANGGIKVGDNIYLAEEIRRYIPIHLRDRYGMPLDDLAEIFKRDYPNYGIETPDDLLEKCRELYRR